MPLYKVEVTKTAIVNVDDASDAKHVGTRKVRNEDPDTVVTEQVNSLDVVPRAWR